MMLGSDVWHKEHTQCHIISFWYTDRIYVGQESVSRSNILDNDDVEFI